MKRILFILLAAMLLVLCFSTAAFASDGEPGGAAAVNWTQLLIAVVGLVFTAVITPGVRAWFVWLRSRTENEAVLTAITESQAVADNVVARLQANIVDGLKAKASDGKLSADDGKYVMESAIKMFLADISDGALSIIEKNSKSASEYITSLIEARLLKLKVNKRGA